MKKLVLIGLLLLLSTQVTFAETQAEWNFKHKAYIGAYSKAMYVQAYGPDFVPPEHMWDECSPVGLYLL